MAEARITLPEKVSFRQTAIYTGPQDARGKDATVVEQQPGRIVFRTTRPLPPHNGLTVAAAWQKGVIEPPTAAQLAALLARGQSRPGDCGRRAALAHPATTPSRGCASAAIRRSAPSSRCSGRPTDMSPAAARYVDRMSFDNHCFTAAIINLGVKGHLRIVEERGNRRSQKRGGSRGRARGRTRCRAAVRGGTTQLLLNQTNHVPLGRAKNGPSEALEQSYLGKLFANNYGWSGDRSGPAGRSSSWPCCSSAARRPHARAGGADRELIRRAAR